MLQEKVLAGKYKDYAVVYDHIKNMAGDDGKEQRLIAVEWRNGDRSLLQINSMTCKRIMESMFGYVPKEL